MNSREWRKHVAELADEFGYETSITGGNHYRLTKPDRPVVFTSLSSSDWRTVQNLRAQLRRNETCHCRNADACHICSAGTDVRT